MEITIVKLKDSFSINNLMRNSDSSKIIVDSAIQMSNTYSYTNTNMNNTHSYSNTSMNNTYSYTNTIMNSTYLFTDTNTSNTNTNMSNHR